MAGIGMYGVYYAKATVTNGVVTGYTGGAKQMGKAISATFTPGERDGNPLYANNGIAERDGVGASTGELSLTLDRLDLDAAVDLYGLTKSEVTVGSGADAATGTGVSYTGSEAPNIVGVAFIRWRQEDNVRTYHEAVIFGAVTFDAPTDNYNTLGESVDWQTPELTGAVYGAATTGALPWKQSYTFETQEAAIDYIESVFAAS